MANASVYLLVGDEEFLKEEWLENLKQKFFKRGETANAPDFNLFFAKDADPLYILSIARTRPLVDNKRLIIIRDAEFLGHPARQEAILSYLKDPSPHSILVLAASVSHKEFLADKFLVEMGKLAEVVSFKKLYDADLYGWISKRAALRKKRIEPGASELLRALKGNNLRILDNEIEKLSIYAGQRDAITREGAKALVGRDAEASVYDIIDAIARGDKGRVLALSFDFNARELGGSAGLFCWNLRFILRARECLNKGWPQQRIADYMGIRKFQLDRVVSQARQVNPEWLRFAIGEITAFDLKIKTSGFCDPFLGWQMLLVRLLSALP